MYPLGVCLTGSPFDLTSLLLALRGGRGARIPNINFSTMASSKKSSYQTALDISPNDEQTFSPAEHWPRFITLEAVLSDSQPKPLTKMSPFGIQGMVGTPKSVKKLKSGAPLIEVTKKQLSTSLLDLKLLANIPVIGKVHIVLNQSKDILFDRDLDLDCIPEEEIKSELESQGVVSVKRFSNN